MWALAKVLSNASAKLVATFFMVIVLILVAFATMPEAINALKEGIQHFLLTDFMRDPPLNAQGEMLFDMLITDAAVFGIIMTLTARMLVELIWYGSGVLWRLVNPPEDAPASRRPANGSGDFYGES
ncbi:MAG: hypothetical protein GYB42_03885 [Alphaproteobacteria bacterium]|nr:hypothetical protein [Alphaproteobacteria bacterium]